jgi:hypothetical protein
VVLGLWYLYVKIIGVGYLALFLKRGAKEKDPKSAFPTISSNHHHVGSQMVLAK